MCDTILEMSPPQHQHGTAIHIIGHVMCYITHHMSHMTCHKSLENSHGPHVWHHFRNVTTPASTWDCNTCHRACHVLHHTSHHITSLLPLVNIYIILVVLNLMTMAQVKKTNKYCAPNISRHTWSKTSSIISCITIVDETIEYYKGPLEYKTAHGSLQILETDDLGKASKILITGGTSNRISLYYNTELKLTKCALVAEFGFCKMLKQLPTTKTLKCLTCDKYIHQKCDTLQGTKLQNQYKYPMCRKKDKNKNKK